MTSLWLGGYASAGALGAVLYGLMLKAKAVSENQSRNNLVSLFQLQPDKVWVRVEGVEIEIPFEQLRIGDTLVAHAGQIIPVDGRVTAGEATVDQQMLTGEAQPVEKSVGDPVMASTLLDVFGLTNLQLGTAFSVFGVLALASYLPGGLLADRFSARRLMSAAIITTALGGVVLARIPTFRVLVVLYGFWGLTTILLFRAALIRATREWGVSASQGRAFGLLKGGRGFLCRRRSLTFRWPPSLA